MNMKTITEQHLIEYELYLRKNEKSSNTISKYLRDVRKYQSYLGSAEAEREKTIAYKQHLIETGYAYSSINSMLASLNSFFDLMEWTECKVKNLKLQRKIYTPENLQLSKKDVHQLIQSALQKRNDRLALLIQTLYMTGIRVSELEYLTVESLETGEFTVCCKGKIRTVLIVKKLQKKLLNYVHKKGISS